GHVGDALPLGGHLGHALRNGLLGLGMQAQGQAQRGRGSLARVIVRRGADATAYQDDIARFEAAPQAGREHLAIVGQNFGARQAQPARGQQFDYLGEVLVLAAAGKNLIAYDDQADTARRRGSDHVFSMSQGWASMTRSWRSRRKASSP